MPLNIDYVQILLHMLNFVILAGGLALILFNPVRKFIKERQDRFREQEEANRNSELENKRIRDELDAERAAFEQEMSAARLAVEKEAADMAKSYIESSKAEAAEIIERAEKEAEKRREHILDSAQTEIGELVIGAAQKLLGDTASPEQTRALYDAFLKQAEQNAAKKDKRSPK